jgi:hypothetical protein
MGVTDEKASVLARYPTATAWNDPDHLAYHAWRILVEPGAVRSHLGGGPTEDEAWRNAWVHMQTRRRMAEAIWRRED